jgi:hypothetical protein
VVCDAYYESDHGSDGAHEPVQRPPSMSQATAGTIGTICDFRTSSMLGFHRLTPYAAAAVSECDPEHKAPLSRMKRILPLDTG